MHDEYVRQRGKARDGGKIEHRIERQFFMQAGIDAERRRDSEQRVTVGRRFRDRLSAVQAASTGPVVLTPR